MDDLISRKSAIEAIHCNITITGRQNAELVAETIGMFADRIKALPSAKPEIESIGYKDCVTAVVRMWLDDILTYGEYIRIMDKLCTHCTHCGKEQEAEDDD